jgi:hypothetical protein
MPGTADTSIVINLKEIKYLGSVDKRYKYYNVKIVEEVGDNLLQTYKKMYSCHHQQHP